MRYDQSRYHPVRACVQLSLLFLLGASCTGANAKIYKTVDADGNVSYTDVAPTQREQEAELQVEELNTFTSPTQEPAPLPTVVLNNPDNDGDLAPAGYETVSLVSPTDDQAIRANNGNITLTANISPDLHPTHSVRFYIDNSPAGTVNGLNLSLNNVDRGTHTAKVAVVDDTGAVISESGSVSFHVQRITQRQFQRNQQRRPRTAPPP